MNSMRKVNEITHDLKYEFDFLNTFGVPSMFDENPYNNKYVKRGRVILTDPSKIPNITGDLFKGPF